MSEMSEFIKNLSNFLSTEARKRVFLYYVFSKISPSAIVQETKIPFSTVDRITQLLKAQNILKKERGKDRRETVYWVNIDFWVEENLKYLGFDFLEKNQLEEIKKFFRDKNFFVLSFLFTNSKFIQKFFKDVLKIGDDLPFLLLMHLNEIQENLACLPSYILIFLQFSPALKKLAKDIENEFLDEDVLMVNEEIKKNYPFIKDVFITKDSLLDFEKKRIMLSKIVEKIFEKKLLKMSLEKVEISKEK